MKTQQNKYLADQISKPKPTALTHYFSTSLTSLTTDTEMKSKRIRELTTAYF